MTAGNAGANPRGTVNIPSLDGIRAFSFGVVFLAHAGLGQWIPGGFGVTVFFFLSGYLITTLLRLEAAKKGTVSLRSFYLRRALRILPPFYLVLAIALALTFASILPGPLQPGAVLSQALYFANYWIIGHGAGGQASGTGVYWSLAVEEHFYLLFPLLYLFFLRRRLSPKSQALLIWSLCAAILVWRCVLVYVLHSSPDRTFMASDTRVDSILFGCALAVYGNPILDTVRRVPEAIWKRVLLPLGIAAILGSPFLDHQARESVRYSLQGLALYPIFVAAIRWPQWLPFKILNLRSVKFVGVLSYSLYLLHQVVIYAIYQQTEEPTVLKGAVAFVIALAAAWVIYEVVEKPSARLRRRLEAVPTPGPALASMASG